jgi:hypothetical protein
MSLCTPTLRSTMYIEDVNAMDARSWSVSDIRNAMARTCWASDDETYGGKAIRRAICVMRMIKKRSTLCIEVRDMRSRGVLKSEYRQSVNDVRGISHSEDYPRDVSVAQRIEWMETRLPRPGPRLLICLACPFNGAGRTMTGDPSWS